MTVQVLTEHDVCELLAAVGASPAAAGGELDRSFEDLGLDSLARIEIASRVRDRYGVDVEDELNPQETPAGLRNLVNSRLAGAGA